MAGKKQNPLSQDKISDICLLSQMAHVFYMGMKRVGASDAEAAHGVQSFVFAVWHEYSEDAREKRRRDEQEKAE